MKKAEFWAAGLVVAACLAPFAAGRYWLDVAFMAAVYAGVASAWNVAAGFSGTFSFGHGLFFGIGAYTSAMLFSALGISPWIGLAAGAALAGAAGAAIGWLGTRYRVGGLSFAVLTLAFAEVALLFVSTFDPLGASRGISIAPPQPPGLLSMQFESAAGFFLVALGFLALCQAVAWAIDAAPLGYRYRAVRENETAAQAMGVSPALVRMSAMAATGALTAAGGSIYGFYLLFVEPRTFFGPDVTIKVILFALVGGIGTVWGPGVGTALLYPAGEWLRAVFGGRVPGLDILVYGSLVIGCCLAFPTGIVGGVGRRRAARAGRGGGAGGRTAG